MSRKTLRVGILGLAGDAELWARAYRNAPDAELVALADTVAARRKAFADAEEEVVNSLDALLGAGVDVVEINLPPKQQADAALQLSKAGIHLGLRFPIAPSLEQARELLAKASGRAVRAGSVHEYFPAVTHAQRFLAETRLGSLMNLRVKAIAGKGGWRECRELPPLPPDLEHYGRPWQALGLLRLVGKPAAVHLIGKPESAIVSVRYQSGDRFGQYEAFVAPDTIVYSEAAPAAEIVEIAGTDGYIYLNRLSGHVREAPALATMIHDTYSQYAGSLPVDWQSAFDAAAADLLNAAREKRSPKQDLHDGIATLRLLLAVEESRKSGAEAMLND